MRKAVIPAAGRGTRMQPFTHAVPKELVPLGSRPAIDGVIREALAAGLDQIAIILSPDKPLIRTYLERVVELGELPQVELHFIFQEEPKGLAEAMALAQPFSGDEPFALLLPDNAFLSPSYTLSGMVRAAEELGRDVIGVIEVTAEQSGLFGNSGRIDFEPIREGVMDIQRLADKGPGRMIVPPGETVLRTCGRYICLPHVFDYIDRVRPSVQGEYSEVPVYQRIIAEKGATGCLLPSPLFDVGHPSGFLAANAYLASRETSE